MRGEFAEAVVTVEFFAYSGDKPLCRLRGVEQAQEVLKVGHIRIVGKQHAIAECENRFGHARGELLQVVSGLSRHFLETDGGELVVLHRVGAVSDGDLSHIYLYLQFKKLRYVCLRSSLEVLSVKVVRNGVSIFWIFRYLSIGVELLGDDLVEQGVQLGEGTAYGVVGGVGEPAVGGYGTSVAVAGGTGVGAVLQEPEDGPSVGTCVGEQVFGAPAARGAVAAAVVARAVGAVFEGVIDRRQGGTGAGAAIGGDDIEVAAEDFAVHSLADSPICLPCGETQGVLLRDALRVRHYLADYGADSALHIRIGGQQPLDAGIIFNVNRRHTMRADSGKG